MKINSLISGYKRVINDIYSPKNYHQRLITFLENYKPRRKGHYRFNLSSVIALLKSIWILGIKEKERLYYWKLFAWSLFRRPRLFPMVIELSIKGFHFRKIAEEYSSS